MQVDGAQIENSSSKKLFGWYRTKFWETIQQIYVKAKTKLKALARIAPFININTKKVLMKAFFYDLI